MNSRNDDEGRWIVTTCRGRLAHLQESLETWLMRMPHWHPIVVCCDDRAAFEYVRDVLATSKRGTVLATQQGETFHKLDAFRLAVEFLESGPVLTGQSYEPGARWFLAPQRPRGRVVLFDADTIALTTTQRALEAVTAGSFGVAGGGIIDDIGLLLADFDVLDFALSRIERDTFIGYGHEDIALRIGAWVATGGKVEKIPVGNWARKIHHDRLRRAYNTTENLRESAAKNAIALAALLKRLVPDERARAVCAHDCFPWVPHESRERPQ